MDCFGGKRKNSSKQCEKKLRGLSGKVRLLEEEIKAMMCEREKESRCYERDGLVFAFKEGEWKQEKKKLKEEVRRLRKMLDDKEEEDHQKAKNHLSFSSPGGNYSVASSMFVEQLKEERIWRDEAVEKWKKLYLAIKTELDDLLERTQYSGYVMYSKAEEEEMIEELRMEVKSKDKTIEELKAKLASMENEEYKIKREVDILRQSLRIMTSRKVSSFPLTKPKFAFVKQAKKT